jgi:LSD1 subclass zinc finger protein
MSITLMCPNLLCRKILMVPNDLRGQRVRCSYCGNILLVPSKGIKPKVQSQEPVDLVSAESDPDGKDKKK